MDDENYFCFDGDNIPGSTRYHTNGKAQFSDDVRFLGKEKCPKKILMRIALSNHVKAIFSPI